MKANRLPFAALASALSLPLVALIIHPSVELGLNDDWSYARSAQVLAQTGQVVYNGWSTAMLGWHLLLGAIFIKVFGFSFLTLRAATLLVATLTAFLFHRILVRCGINEKNSTIGTLTLVLSPLFLPLTFSFMTDIGGLFVILLCLYGCLRALTAPSTRTAFAWLCFACLSNAIGGSVRQIAWLGVLVVVPSTLWLLRNRHRHLVLPGATLIFSSVVSIYLSLRWFSHQPFTVPERLIPGPITLQPLVHLIGSLLHTVLEFPFFLLPVLLLFVPAVPKTRRTLQLLLPVLMFALAFAILQYHRHKLFGWLFPYLGNYVTIYGLMGATPIKGVRPIVLSKGLRLGLTVVSLLAVLALFIFVFTAGPRESTLRRSAEEPAILSWRDLRMLLLPFAAAYVALLMPRGAFGAIFDRYLLALIAVALIPLLRLYQERVWPLAGLRQRALVLSLPGLFIYSVLGIAGTHDLFALFRAQASAIDALLAAGVSPSRIDAGFEFNGWTQIMKTGFVAEPRLNAPPSAVVVLPPEKPCKPMMGFLFPSQTPEYALSYQPRLCEGDAGFPPVPYDTWIPHQSSFVYIIRERILPSD